MKKPTLGGSLFVRNGIQYDYCFMEAVRCLQSFCDEVVVLDAGSDDGTFQELKKLKDKNTTLVHVGKSEWDKQKGREKLAYFTNLAAAFITSDYHFNLQADEVVHQDSFEAIREAITTGDEAFMVSRINLWGSPYKQLCVPQERKPCSTEVIRLAKPCYVSVDDAENIAAPISHYKWLDKIRIYHFGFVRNKHVMKDKIINMQQGVFQMVDHDPKLHGMEVFDWRAWFGEDDLQPIKEDLPVFVQQWSKERHEINTKP